MILRRRAGGSLARASGGAPQVGGRRGNKGRRSAGGRQKKGGTGAQSDGIVKQVRVGGRPMQLHAMEILADSDNPYAGIPGGGDQEAADAIGEAGAATIRGDHKEARRICKGILARFPNHYIANYNMGMDCRLAGKPRSAIKYLKRAIRVWPENHTAHAGLGRVLLDMKLYDKALESLDRALEIQPGDHLALRDREEALESMGRSGQV